MSYLDCLLMQSIGVVKVCWRWRFLTDLVRSLSRCGHLDVHHEMVSPIPLLLHLLFFRWFPLCRRNLTPEVSCNATNDRFDDFFGHRDVIDVILDVIAWRDSVF